MKRILLAVALGVGATPSAHAAPMPRELQVTFARAKSLAIWPPFKCAALAIGSRDPKWMPWGLDQLEKTRTYAIKLAEEIVFRPALWNEMDMDGEASGTFPLTVSAEFLVGMWFQAVWDKQRFIMQGDLLNAELAGRSYQTVWLARFHSSQCDRPFKEWLFDFGKSKW